QSPLEGAPKSGRKPGEAPDRFDGSSRRFPATGRSGGELPQHIMQDAAVEEIFQLIGGIDAAKRLEGEAGAIGAGGVYRHALAWLEAAHIADGEALVTRQAECLAAAAFRELQRQHAH